MCLAYLLISMQYRILFHHWSTEKENVFEWRVNFYSTDKSLLITDTLKLRAFDNK